MMMRKRENIKDFTLEKYKQLCNAIKKSECTPLTVQQYLSNSKPSSFIILRHDVDRKPFNALRMAELENKLEIHSTYYFRTVTGVFKPDIIKRIASMGHEIGYHYETLSLTKGNFQRAIEIFKRDLAKFRNIGIDVKTICAHGSPLSKYDNGDLWNRYKWKDFGILGEAYKSVNFVKIPYFTDTARSWNGKANIRDRMDKSNSSFQSIKSTDNLIDLISSKSLDKLYILAHPNRWASNAMEWITELIWQNIKNVGKIGIKWLRNLKYD